MRITVIGAGPGGYTAAFAAAKRGADVTLIEAKWLGGTCLNCGCIPTKSLKASAEALETIHRAAEFGITGTGSSAIDLPAVMARKRKISEILRGGLEKTCQKLKVSLIMGRAQVVNSNLVKVTSSDGSIQDIASDNVIIATGSTTLDLPVLPVDGTFILSSDEALDLDHIPETLVIVGGGVVGTELAFIFRAFGAQVTIVEGQDRLLPIPSVDEEMSKLVQREAKKRGIKVELGRTVTSSHVENDKVFLELGPSPFLPPEKLPTAAKKILTLDCDCVFTTVGRAANTKGLGLAEAGIKTDKRGFVVANEYLETSVPGIYAIGDILGPARIMLAHMASAEALVAVNNIFGAREIPDYKVVPSGIFTSPEVGDVGLTEVQAKAAGFEVVTSELHIRELGKAQAMGELSGMFKLVAEKSSGRLLGAHFAGAHATDLISEAALALHMGAAVTDIAHTIHAHPTLAEGIMEAAYTLAE